MRLGNLVFVALFIVSGIFYYHATATVVDVGTFKVARVIDGDTVELEDGKRVRFLGINTPEKGFAYYEEAREFLRNLVENKTVRIESSELDKYGRILGYVFLDGENVNEKILRAGLATLYYYDRDGYYEDFRRAEELARENEIGIWGRSGNWGCVELVRLETDEPEELVLENVCDFEIEIFYKDDATHIYEASLSPRSTYAENFSHIWNTDGDSLYVYDNKGLLIFYRY